MTARDPQHQAAIDGRQADTDRIIAVARVFAGDDPELKRQLDATIAEVEQSRRENP